MVTNMTVMSKKIMRRVKAKGRGKWVFTAKDFLDLGNRAAVDQALSRLTKKGDLRRVGRGLYDWPRMSSFLRRLVPANIDLAVAAVVRRDNVRVMPGGLAAANMLGLTNAVPAQIIYSTDGPTRNVEIDNRTVRFRHTSPSVMAWAGKPAALVMLALCWLGPDIASDSSVAATLKRKLPDYVKQDLVRNKAMLPGWAVPIALNVAGMEDG